MDKGLQISMIGHVVTRNWRKCCWLNTNNTNEGSQRAHCISQKHEQDVRRKVLSSTTPHWPSSATSRMQGVVWGCCHHSVRKGASFCATLVTVKRCGSSFSVGLGYALLTPKHLQFGVRTRESSRTGVLRRTFNQIQEQPVTFHSR